MKLGFIRIRLCLLIMLALSLPMNYAETGFATGG